MYVYFCFSFVCLFVFSYCYFYPMPGYMCTAGASEVTDSMKCKAGHYCPIGTKVEVIMIRFGNK